MSLSPAGIGKIAHLARLQLDANRLDHYADNLSAIFALIEQMNAIDTTGVIPMAHPRHATQRLREDIVTETDRRDHWQRCAPMIGDGLYLVPKVVE